MTFRGEADNPMTNELRLAEALAALICHDLSGPLGAMTSALELAQQPTTATEALALARDATIRMGQQLRLMRASWGGPSSAMSRTEFLKLATGLPPSIDVVIDGLRGQVFEGNGARVLLNATAVAAMALPRGGTIAVAGDLETGVTILPIGHKAAWPSSLSSSLLKPETCAVDDPRQAPVAFLGYLTRAAGMRATVLLPSGMTAATCPPLLLARLT